MNNYITIDGGTTNTRISLVTEGNIADTLKLSVGARAGIDDKNILAESVKQGIEDILSRNNMKSSDISKILASGMITCEFGLYKVDHIPVPAGIDELHNSMCEVVLKDISDIPFVFIRGVKGRGAEVGMLEQCDMMRGEETEFVGIQVMENISGDCAFVLPGSHSKVIKTDEYGRISSFSTMLTGEMIAALSQNTILEDAVDLSINQTDSKYLIMGYDYCCGHGINEALFKVRVLKNSLKRNKQEVYSFFLGAVLYGEIQEIIKCDSKKVAIGGKKQIKDAMTEILKNVCDKEIISISDETVEKSTAIGAVSVYER